MTVTTASPRREGSVAVKGGREIGFAEWGDPDGHPVAMFHGGPGSRWLGIGCEEVADELGLRMVCLERPGFGRSDHDPNRTVLGWADDVADATSALGIDHFVAVGVSAGSPYALACAARPTPRLDAVGVIAGAVPARFNPDDPLVQLVERDHTEAEAAVRDYFETMAADVDGSARAMSAREGPDRKILERRDVQQRFATTRREAFRHGVDGAVLDLMLVHQPWGFDLNDLSVTTRWWHGSLDPIVPVASVRAATAATPIELTIYEDQGHAIGFEHGAQILSALVVAHERRS
jgi:pimeloyl-ACP methyl ester carboxylesterase